MTDKKEARLFLYLGMREGEKNKYPHAYYDVTGLENIGSPLKWEDENETWYKKPLFRASPGMIYEVQTDGTNTTRGGSYKGRWENNDQVSGWEIKTRALLEKRKLSGKVSKEIREKIYQQNLDPIRDIYFHNPGMRVQILSAVISYITQGVKI